MVYQYQPVNPLQSFAQGFQFTDAIRQRQAQQEQQRMEMAQKEQRGMQLQQAIQSIRTNPSPEAIAEFYLQFPEMKEQFEAYRGALAEGDKGTLTSAAREAIVAQRSGQSSAEVFKRYAEAAKNSRRMDLAKQFEDAAAMADASPDAADLTTRMFFQGVDPDGYKAIFAAQDPTAFQKDFEFIKQQFGEDAATEFAQFGREGAPVSIPLGNGQTYVGPASMAPGARRWQQQGGQVQGDAAMEPSQPTGQEPSILENAFNTKTITPEEAAVVRKSLGPNGQAAFEKWMRNNKIVISRVVGGKTYYQVNGKWYDNPEGR